MEFRMKHFTPPCHSASEWPQNGNNYYWWLFLESLSQLQVGWIFAWSGVVPPPFFAWNRVLAEGWGIFLSPILLFHRPGVTLKVWAKSELMEFLPCLVVPPLFCLKSSFGQRRVKNHLKSQSFVSLSVPWKFEPNLSWLSFCLIWGGPAPPPFFP